MAEASTAEENETPKAMATDSFTLCSFVDEVESRVDMLRRQATALMGERASLLMIMEQLKSDCMNVDIPPEDCQELVTNMERLKARCEAVEIQVHTVRDEGQLQSLHKVNSALEELEDRLFSSQNVSMTAGGKARSYLNACLPEPVGPIDSRFQSLVLGCTVDDQKDVQRHLESLVRELSLSSSSPRIKPKDTSSRADLSNNSSEVVNSLSSLGGLTSSPQSSNITRDENSKENEIDNHLTAHWNAAPKDLSCDQEKQPVQTEGEGRHSQSGSSSAHNKEHNTSVFDSSS
ncbi:BAG family molecular chaperone regulator 2-like [Babylonia areolata]|uniref:BAG family molecular chaperone regulator 2-like n=1 Tax=Babylonia areolata TaxID=304850 RepID=UPI003FD2E770